MYCQPSHSTMRVHGNFVEYAPFSLITILMLELQSAVDTACPSLLLARSFHAYGMSQEPEDYYSRVAGMTLTFSPPGDAVISLLLIYLLVLIR